MITLKTLEKATAREVFEQVKTHLLTQNEKCGTGNPNSTQCLLRNDKGLNCAAGCLISDEEYKEEWEGTGPWRFLVAHNKVPGAHCYLISNLQKVHDVHAVKHWSEELDKVEREYLS